MALAVWQSTITNESGDIQASAQIEVRNEATGALAAIYADRDGNTPLDNPFSADSNGFARFYAAGGAYKITASLGDFSHTYRHQSIGLLAEQDVATDDQFYYRQTAAEIAAGVTPADYSYPPGDVRRYGAQGDGVTDDTDAFKAMLSFPGEKYVPKATYLTSSFSLSDNIRLFIEPGTIIRDSGALGNSVRLMNIVDVSNIHIIGWGAKILMDRDDYTSGEQRHGVNIREATNVTIEGLESSDCGGDGFYVGGDAAPSVNVTLIGCRADNNRRQGFSVVTGRRIRLIDCEATNTTGTSPSGGFDIEPNNDTDVLEDIQLVRCRAVGNDGAGLYIFLANWDAVSNYCDILIDRLYTENNGAVEQTNRLRPGIDINRIPSVTPCKGRIVIRDHISKGDQQAAVHIYNWDENGPRVELHRSTIINPNQAGGNDANINGGIIMYNNGAHTTTPGNVRIYAPMIRDDDNNLASNGLTAIMAHDAAGDGWSNVEIHNPTVEWAGSTPWAITSSNRDVRVFNDVPPKVALASGGTITDGRYFGRVVTNGGASGTTVVTLPQATAARVGWRLHFEIAAAHQMRIDPDGTDLIRGGTAGQYLASSTIGDNVTIECDGAGTWKIVSLYGTWSFT